MEGKSQLLESFPCVVEEKHRLCGERNAVKPWEEKQQKVLDSLGLLLKPRSMRGQGGL